MTARIELYSHDIKINGQELAKDQSLILELGGPDQPSQATLDCEDQTINVSTIPGTTIAYSDYIKAKTYQLTGKSSITFGDYEGIPCATIINVPSENS